MSNSRSPKRKIIDVAEEETKVVPVNTSQVSSTTLGVNQALACSRSNILTLAQVQEIIAAKAGKSAPQLISALKKMLHDWDIPLTVAIINAAIKDACNVISFCARIQTLHREGIDITEAVVKSISQDSFGYRITEMLQDLHNRGIILIDHIVQAVDLAVRLKLEKEYFVALLLLHYNNFLYSDSIHAVSQFLEDPLDVASNIIRRGEAENAILLNQFNNFMNDPVESEALPLPSVIKSIVGGFFSPLTMGSKEIEAIQSYVALLPKR